MENAFESTAAALFAGYPGFPRTGTHGDVDGRRRGAEGTSFESVRRRAQSQGSRERQEAKGHAAIGIERMPVFQSRMVIPPKVHEPARVRVAVGAEGCALLRSTLPKVQAVCTLTNQSSGT